MAPFASVPRLLAPLTRKAIPVVSQRAGAFRPLFGSRAFSTIPPELLAEPPTLVTQLPNGLRVASQRSADETATVGVFIDSGSRYETRETNGAAHFLEHMAFKGTGRRNRVQLEKEVENIGAHLNAYTAREQTVYYAKCFKKDIPQMVDVLSDILTNSNFAQGAIEEEKHVILREMEEVEKSFEEVVFDRLHMVAFRDSPLGFTILGPEENIRNMKREYITDYIRRNYTADRIVFAACGDIDHADVVKLAEKHLMGFKPSELQRVTPPERKPYFCGNELIYRNDEMGPIAHIAIGYEGIPWKSADQPTFTLMASIIGTYKKHDEGLVPGTVSGNRTTNNVANKMNVGCCESYCGFNTCYKDTGIFGFYIQADEVAVEHAISELLFGVTAMSYSVTEEEVQKAKLQLMTNMFGSLDTTTAICEDIGRHLLVFGRRVPQAELYRRLDVLDAEEVKRVAWKYLHDVDLAVTAVGPLAGMPQYFDMRRSTFWSRY